MPGALPKPRVKKQEPAKHPFPADLEPAHSRERWAGPGAAGKGLRAQPHLPLAELQHLGQALPLGRGEVFLRLELLFQLDGLVVGEADLPPFPLVQRPLDEGAPEQRLPYRERDSPGSAARDTSDRGAQPCPGPGLADFLRLILFLPVPTLIFPLSDFFPLRQTERETS